VSARLPGSSPSGPLPNRVQTFRSVRVSRARATTCRGRFGVPACRPARMDSYERAQGSIAARTRDLGIRSRVGAPIIVDDMVWGLAVVYGGTRFRSFGTDRECALCSQFRLRRRVPIAGHRCGEFMGPAVAITIGAPPPVGVSD
jgi:hypothetical protein